MQAAIAGSDRRREKGEEKEKKESHVCLCYSVQCVGFLIVLLR